MSELPTPTPKKINWLAFLLEERQLSMGRVMAWVMFGILVYMWLASVAVPETLITSFYVLLSYNFSKKLLPLAAILPKIGQKFQEARKVGEDSKDKT